MKEGRKARRPAGKTGKLRDKGKGGPEGQARRGGSQGNTRDKQDHMS